MRLDSTQALERLAVAEAVDSSWLCRAARALDELDQSFSRLELELNGAAGELVDATRRNPRLARAASRARADRQRLHEQARSLRRRLVLATKDAGLGLELKAELMGLSREANAYFRRVRRFMWESFARATPDERSASALGGFRSRCVK